MLSACSPAGKPAADKLNALSYACHYRSLDSTEHYARMAIEAASDYPDGRAEALNNLAFVRIAQMRYEEAAELLAQIAHNTDNQIELLVADVQQMRLCQRESRNRAFYDWREQAHHALRRIGEERHTLTPRQQQRMCYAESELAIVTSTYYYYVGLERQAQQALRAMPQQLERDTAQLLNYLYYVGSGGIITTGTQDDINQQEFDHLMRCFLLARQEGVTYFEANSLEALAEHLMVDEYRVKLVANNLPACKYLSPHGLPDDSIALWLADRSLRLFQQYGDVYQTAGAHRTLASCHLQRGSYEQALEQLQLALSDTIINKAPDLVASIYEQLSVAYAAIDDKQCSDAHRNAYLDLQEQTRQDRSLEAHAAQLEQEAAQLNWLIAAVVAAIALLGLLLALFYYWHKRQRGGGGETAALRRQEEELNEQLAMARLRVEKGERLALEQRAKVSLVYSITPLIDRILHEAKALSEQPGNRREERQEYISELTDNINEQNDVLTRWIQLRQGELSLHIETFPLQQLFDIIAGSRRSFSMKQLTQTVEPTDCRVKADRVLTLFMINTLADNARKFTPPGGTVRIYARQQENYVEVSVSDTGKGMSDEELAHVFERKIIVDDGGAAAPRPQPSHGFGLLNCKGIIEKYRKMSKIFDVCMLAAESRVGQGSRFYFRLPTGVARMIAALLIACGATASAATAAENTERQWLSTASAYADSAYFSNVAACYDRTLAFADSCRKYLNLYYRQGHPDGADTLLAYGDPSVVPPEVKWYHDSAKVNYNILLTIRNESAVAALALHQWPLYHYNNRIYTQLFKELSADNTLAEYCRRMKQSQTNKQVAIILLVALFIAILMALVGQVLRSMGRVARRQQEKQQELEMARDELLRTQQEESALHVSNAVLDNCLSTLKHETMYYPSRIRQLLDADDSASLREVVAYYRELYGILSLQAMRQTEHTRLHMRHLDHGLLGDPVLVGYLFDILRKQGGSRMLDATYEPKGEKYVVCTVAMPRLSLSEEQAAQLFTPAADNIPYLLCRQIVRDHGEATNRRGCAIRAEVRQGATVVVVTLPRANQPLNDRKQE